MNGMASLVRPSGGVIILVAAFCLLTFGFGGTIGAEAATNESVTLDQQLDAVDLAGRNAHQQVNENVSSDTERAAYRLSGGDAILDVVMWSAKQGVRWGYHHPQQALFVADNVDIVALGLVGAYTGHRFQKLRERR